MRSRYKHSPGPQESIAPNRLSKFDREHAFSSIFRFLSIDSPIESKIEFSSKKRAPGRILKNVVVQSSPEILENANTEGA